MSSELTSMESLCDKSLLAGIKVLEYAPLAWIDTFPEYLTDDHEYNIAVGFIPTKNWLTAVFTKGSAVHSVKQKKNKDGDLFPTMIKAEFPWASKGAAELFKRMNVERFILKITDYSDKVYLIGSPDLPMRFSFERLSGGSPGEFAGYKYDFFGLNTAVPPHYNP